MAWDNEKMEIITINANGWIICKMIKMPQNQKLFNEFKAQINIKFFYKYLLMKQSIAEESGWNAKK